MNTRMFENPITQDNLRICERYGMEVISPASGYLACGDTGAGKMPEPEVLLQYILKEIRYEKDLAGKKILVTAGPTREAIDPVRYITNHSTGKMGYAIAKTAAYRGAQVTLVTGPAAFPPPLLRRFYDLVGRHLMAHEPGPAHLPVEFLVALAVGLSAPAPARVSASDSL